MLGKMVEETAKRGATLSVCVLVERTSGVIPRGGEGVSCPSTKLKSWLQPLKQSSNQFQLLQLQYTEPEAHLHSHNERANR
jgi:hypothetical protein